MKSEVDQIIDNLEFCIETIGLNDEQTGEVLAATNELGVNVEYFCQMSLWKQVVKKYTKVTT